MESHEPYHHLPPSEWARVARELQAEERRTGRVNYAAVPPSLPWVVADGEAGPQAAAQASQSNCLDLPV